MNFRRFPLRSIFLGVAMFAYGGSARAAIVCPFVTIGWSQSWYNQPILSANYDSGTQLLFIVFSTQFVTAFSNVPTSIMTALSQAPNPMLYYSTIIYPTFHPLVLAQVDNCPLRYETGAYIWSQ
jgi:hypothetical protein